MDQNAVEAILFGATKLRELQVDSGYEIYEQSKDRFGELLTAHMLAVGAIGTVLSRKESESVEVASDSQQQIVLISSFIQGINIVDCSISEGYYIQATVLVRQELETILALEELNQSKTVAKGGSEIIHLPRTLAKLFGDLSDIDDTAVHNILKDILTTDATELQNATTGLLMAQEFNEQRSWRLFGLHVSLLIVLAVLINEYYEAIHGEGQGLNEIELQVLINAQKILLDCEWITQQA